MPSDSLRSRVALVPVPNPECSTARPHRLGGLRGPHPGTMATSPRSGRHHRPSAARRCRCDSSSSSPEWLAALAPGGRLVIPLTLHIPGIYDCVNTRDPANEDELRKLTALGPSGQLARRRHRGRRAARSRRPLPAPPVVSACRGDDRLPTSTAVPCRV